MSYYEKYLKYKSKYLKYGAGLKDDPFLSHTKTYADKKRNYKYSGSAINLELSNEIKNFITKTLSGDSSYFCMPKQANYPLDHNSIQLWKINNCNTNNEKYAQKEVDKLMYVSWGHFYSSMTAMIMNIKSDLISILNYKQDNISIFLPELDMHTSNFWSTMLFFKILKEEINDENLYDNLLKNVTFIFNVEQYRDKLLQQTKKDYWNSVKEYLLYIDDCFYSGLQFSQNITGITGEGSGTVFNSIINKKSLANFNVIVAVPFIKKTFYDKILLARNDVFLFYYVPTIIDGDKYLYFDHKIADNASTNQNMISVGEAKNENQLCKSSVSLTHNCVLMFDQDDPNKIELYDKNLNKTVSRCPPTFYKYIEYSEDIFKKYLSLTNGPTDIFGAKSHKKI